jgi:hypothetical protein
LTQRFGQFLHAILVLSGQAGDDEPVASSVGRLRSDFDAFLVKCSRAIADNRKRQRFLFNNYSLVLTIIGVSPQPRLKSSTCRAHSVVI